MSEAEPSGYSRPDAGARDQNAGQDAPRRTSSYAHGAHGVPLLGETIGACLEATAARHPDQEALVARHQGLRYTYAQLNAECDVNERVP